MHSKKEIDEIIRLLEADYPDELCSLEYVKDYELLFATRLAAQCTDERVNQVTPAFYAAYPTLQSLAEADVADVEKYIHSCGFYHTKARDIVSAAQMLISDFGGRVPGTMEELLKLPGVGRKTANIILGDVYRKPAVVVDTHCIRLSNRIGLVNFEDPYKIELALRDILPPDKSNDFCHRLVLHGRAVCPARKPKCEICSIRGYCDYGKTH
ncbi:DNA-(apurinic or apyrimidinic site) lyase /endonuclease III [Sporobacter termitidis DSM 10068]|uniref:Endonuclease III n=1 Tax=Sporobacter termitidis DSM 10068 TaxID=1123282 RepID=A0A1M5X0M9_9FIRM|nr:endonuclease III [Sporobacter termitidis]SHH93088.1 DNA-(apurinic or apyrimidinic site) lyase /endonuclease III [Sporobacter termitidis DSM 10068]